MAGIMQGRRSARTRYGRGDSDEKEDEGKLVEPRKTLFLLSGYPGSGKTYRRENDAALERLQSVDMADRYDVAFSDWSTAMAHAISDVGNILENDNAVILEGIFWRNSKSRQLVIDYCEANDWDLQIIEINADQTVCRHRIEDWAFNLTREHPEDRAYIAEKARHRLDLLKRLTDENSDHAGMPGRRGSTSQHHNTGGRYRYSSKVVGGESNGDLLDM